MAQIRLQPPDPFDFKHPDDWPRWKRRFDQFRIASGLQGEGQVKQVSTLLYCMEEESEAVLTSTNATDEERKVYDTVIGKFDAFFRVRKNVIFERARFNRRNQLDGEQVEQYIMELYKLADSCDYGAMKDEMIRDRLVVGIRDGPLSERLQLDPDLTLEKAKKMVRQREAVHDQQQVLKGASSDTHVLEELRPKRGSTQWRGSKPKPKPKQQQQYRQQQRQCTRCGRGQHPRDKCPAKEATCHCCKKKGHYSTQCFSKDVSELSNESPLDTAFLGTVSSTHESSWLAKLHLCERETVFKLDTGAEVTAISELTYQSLGKQTLVSPGKALYGPSRQPLKVVGQFEGRFAHKNKTTVQTVYVVNGLKTNLLGLPAITALNLAARVDSASETILHNVEDDFASVFQGLGNMGEDYEIQLKPDAKPYALYTPRNIALPLRPQVRQELDRMESIGVISKVDEPTPWCAGMVIVPKKSGAIRICVDLKPLNECVLREVHPLPKVDETLAQLTGAKIFTKLDANSGFWQIPLAQQSRLLTTFITPYGRYCFNKLPFGISSAPEHFQKRMSRILEGLEGVQCQMDDVLVFGKDREEHDIRLAAVLKRIQTAGATLNPEKCEFRKTKLKFLGHLIDERGIQADPEKTSAILEMSPPTNIPELRRFMGMVNQLGKFSRNLAQLTQPLRELLSKKRAWLWGPNQDQAFAEVKAELVKPTILTLYDPEAAAKISADASSYGLGAVLLQKSESTWKPVAYASRSMTDTERRYAQVEKEALATTWACDKFANYILGKKIEIETDHKPLVPLLGTKHLDNLPPRVLRFRLRLARYDYSISHVPGKLLHTADTLSRAPTSPTDGEITDTTVQEEAEMLMEVYIAHLPASQQRIDEYRRSQATDPVCSTVVNYCRHGWPDKRNIDPTIMPYWKTRGELTVHDSLLLYGSRIVVPKSLQRETLLKIHEGHQGIQRCRLRARSSVWWPGISQQINDLVHRCSVCVKNSTPRQEPMIPTKLPDHPWQRVGSDLFLLNGVNHLVVVDYFSRYPEVIKLKSTTTTSIVEALKAIFSRHGVPETLVSDNGPQYASQEFSEFARSYDFCHVTSSPYFPQSNGQAERTVQTVKKLLKESSDPYMALLSYRATPLPWCDLTPAELLMGRQLRMNLPVLKEQLSPNWSYLEKFRERNDEYKHKQKRDYDRRHQARPLPPIPDGSEVWVTSDNQPVPGRVTTSAGTPRSYLVETPQGVVRRHRSHLNVVPDSPIASTTPEQPSPPSPLPIMTRSRTGTAIRPPERL